MPGLTLEVLLMQPVLSCMRTTLVCYSHFTNATVNHSWHVAVMGQIPWNRVAARLQEALAIAPSARILLVTDDGQKLDMDSLHKKYPNRVTLLDSNRPPL